MEIKWVPGYEGLYAISDDGVVTSYALNNGNGGQPVRVSQFLVKSGNHQYLMVDLWNNGIRKHFRVHNLVLLTFVGNRPNSMFGLHRDDNKLNNVLGNLYWGTPKQNAEDAKKNGIKLGRPCKAE